MTKSLKEMPFKVDSFFLNLCRLLDNMVQEMVHSVFLNVVGLSSCVATEHVTGVNWNEKCVSD